MPPLPLALTFRALLPGLSTTTDAVLGALVASDGATINATNMARRVGLRSRFQLNRRLQMDGLPAFGELSDWVSVLAVLWQAEANGESLLSVTSRIGLEPATCYRRCRRTLGVPWREVRGRGFAWGLERFLRRCSGRHPRIHRPVRFTATFPTHAAALSAASAQSGPAHHPQKSQLMHPQGVLAFQVAVPDAPTDIAVSSTGRIYVTRAFAAALARIDLDGRRVLRSIDVGSNPTRLALGAGRSAFVTNQFSSSISVIDILADKHIGEIPIPGDPAPLAVAPDGRTLYVATNHDRLYAVSITTRQILRELPLPATSHHLALHPHGSTLFVSTRTAGTVMEVDLPSLRTRRTFETGGQTQALAVAPDATELYVADEGGAVHVVNLESGRPAATVHVPGGAYGLDITPDGTQLYLAMPGEGRVHVLDRVSRRMLHTIPTEGSPRHTAFTDGGRTGLIVNEAGWVSVVW